MPRVCVLLGHFFQVVCLTTLLGSIVSRRELESRLPQLAGPLLSMAELFGSKTTEDTRLDEMHVLVTQVNHMSVWLLLSVACVMLVKDMGLNPVHNLERTKWANWLFAGSFLHNVFVIATVYQKWSTTIFSPPVQALQLFPTVSQNLHSYFQIHYILGRPIQDQSRSVFFRAISFCFNLIMLVHFGMFMHDYSFVIPDYTDVQTLLKAILALFVILHRLIALWNFSDVIFICSGQDVDNFVPPVEREADQLSNDLPGEREYDNHQLHMTQPVEDTTADHHTMVCIINACTQQNQELEVQGYVVAPLVLPMPYPVSAAVQYGGIYYSRPVRVTTHGDSYKRAMFLCGNLTPNHKLHVLVSDQLMRPC